ncbi:MAG: hypothetical protein U0929_04640 [Planctomycetaceae bacterium]
MLLNIRTHSRGISGVLILAVVVCLSVSGCSEAPESPAAEQANQMVFYDRDTKQPVVYNIAREFPAIHPNTGKPSLVPACYCPKCQKWYPSPPLEVRERNPEVMQCPKKCGTKMTLTGPWPETVL